MPLASLATGLLAFASVPSERMKTCLDLLPPQTFQAETRPVDALDLARLRDFGGIGVHAGSPSPFSVSLDGGKIALELRRGDPATNRHCVGIVIIDRKAGHIALVDTGDSVAPLVFDKGVLAAYEDGMPKAAQPLWSPDGQWIAFLKRQDGITQLWRAPIDGRRARPVTQSPVDIEAFAWSRDGHTLVYSSRPALRVARLAIDKEGLSGFHFDERYMPMRSSRPFPRAPIPHEYFAIDERDAAPRAATPAEQKLLSDASAALPKGAVTCSENGRGDLACIERRSSEFLNSPTFLTVRMAKGGSVGCGAAACSDELASLLWDADGAGVYFLRREGWGRSATALYHWRPGDGRPRLIRRTDDLLFGCQLADRAMLCVHEASVRPRRLVQIDLATGQLRALFDPNPEFQAKRIGRVERLRLKNRFGIESFGDLVLPPEPSRQGPHPLIVVGYNSRGFLRGGTGDEYPILAFAARGYAVLSYERPRDIGLIRPARTIAEIVQRNNQDWADRGSVLSSIETAVKLLVDRGIADPTRIGITGFSDGSSIARFALLNSRLFVAAALSSCCEDPVSTTTVVGPMLSEMVRSYGYPQLTKPDPTFWGRYSLALNAERFRTPLLLQMADREYLFALETVSALRERGRPVDLFIYPDEYHVKWQPAHRLAVYRRNLDWFDFWLRGIEHDRPERAQDYERWRGWRSGTDETRATRETRHAVD